MTNFVKVKQVTIPAFFGENVVRYYHLDVMDEYAKSLTLRNCWGGNYKTAEVSVKILKLKQSKFLQLKVENV